MIGKNKIKLINSLKLSKFRNEFKLFIAEGEKVVVELLDSSFKINTLISTAEGLKYLENFHNLPEITEVTEDELKKISTLTTPNKLLAVAEIPECSFDNGKIADSLSLALEEIQDPGNMGTIIRIADWFGISDIFCSENCVDVFNPKVIQSSMGAIFRVKVHYLDLPVFFNDLKTNPGFNIYGTFLSGNDIYSGKLSKNGLILMGNESKGISDQMGSLIYNRLFIPNFSHAKSKSQSLNVSAATAIVCSEFRRRSL
jgi:RNA methyltransferase, TrmH family